MSTLIQRSFAGGELSPSLYARVDQIKYATGAKKLLNGFVRKNGGFTNRAGSFHITEFPGSDLRYVPWDSNDDAQVYVLIFRVDRINFVQGDDLVRVTAVLAWNIATPYVVGDLVVSGGINYYCKLANTGNIPPNITYWFPLVGDEYSIPTPFSNPDSIREMQHAQDGNMTTFVHFRSIPQDLVRLGHTNWVMTPWPQDGSLPPRYGLPGVAAPTGLTASGGGSGGASYVVTAIFESTEESLPSNQADTVTVPSPGTPVTLNWTAVAGAKGYNVYAYAFGTPLFIFFVTGVGFIDTGYTRSPTANTPPETRPQLAVVTGQYPNVVGKYQQRTYLGNLEVDPSLVLGSQIGFPQNFTKRFPTVDDDSLSFRVDGRKRSDVKHIIDVGAMVVFADSGEWIIKGDQSGAILPSSANPEQYSYNGASNLGPIVIGSDAIYVQSQGSIIRSLGFDSLAGGRDGFKDADLTAFADHLVDQKIISAWAYQKTPHSVVWIVLNDGTMLSMTYIKEQQILAFCRHNTDGYYKDVVCVPENDSTAVYFIVNRGLETGFQTRSIEKMHQRDFSDIVDAVFLDNSLSYDGRNESAITMTVSGGAAWNEGEQQTMTASAAFFSAGDVGNEIHLTGPTGEMVRFSIEAFTSTTVVTVRPDKLIPVNMRNVALDTWARAVDSVSGLSHLDGKKVAVFADGCVVANPNNESKYGTAPTVTAGAITLPDCYAVIHVGLPYLTDLETLDIDTANGETIVDKSKYVSKVSCHVKDTRGLFFGAKEPKAGEIATKNLTELRMKENGQPYSTPQELVTGVVTINILAEWNRSGGVFIRQVDPLPMTILSVAPAGLFPFRG